MPPETGTALLILVAFVLPGFVSVLIKERLHDTADPKTEFDRLLQVTYYSIWSYLLLAVFALVFDVRWDEVESYFEGRFEDPAILVLIAAAAILVPSSLVAGTSILWSDSERVLRVKESVGLNINHQTPTAWDHFFDQRRSVMVRVVLKDGRLIGGFYGGNSFAAYAKDGRDIYLERHWQLDPRTGWFDKEAPATEGVWIASDDVVEVEFYTPPRDGQPTGEGRAQATASGESAAASSAESDPPPRPAPGHMPPPQSPPPTSPPPGPTPPPDKPRT